MTIEIGFLLFNGMTQLDFAGPFEVLSRVPGARVHLVADSLDPITADTHLRLLPTVTYDDCPALNVVCVPGGPHVESVYENAAAIDFLRRQAAQADYVTSVCTGSLILGVAGLLDGYKATSHWTSLPLLAHFGAVPTKGRVVTDRNRITGGGVTAGIDFGLTVAAALVGETAAKMIQLGLEYDPAPPFNSGHPDVADKEITDAVLAAMQDRLDTRFKRAAEFA
ncbi:DJ-1/PfpI family protein [Gimibacter soli]|uniref:DJ-1/PfpI family protein n=1 Tax=Gimibacter soli TaxID=3024400 RepID=A0AAF0BHU5_9PROT|nr:DJ-1/PfpI family protein [Gimibacter soli]WCL54628.1 DJ-1/PfpI family protein [Gimibacter soli]